MKLLLIDGHYYVYRSFFAIQNLSNSRGASARVPGQISRGISPSSWPRENSRRPRLRKRSSRMASHIVIGARTTDQALVFWQPCSDGTPG
ncbi:MAG: hypothetical protein H0V56_02865 [Chthoniobacterales bacterium]|nr:hypothetical protein [Chthoniobacterales bacterium]